MKPYSELLAAAPAHDTEEFLQYLRDNNVVYDESDWWLVIENFKYHSKERPWYTAFSKQNRLYEVDWLDLINILMAFHTFTWLKKAASDQSVKRFHIHIHK